MSTTTVGAPEKGATQARAKSPKASTRGMWLPYLGIA